MKMMSFALLVMMCFVKSTFSQSDSCSSLVTCLAEYGRQIAQCQSNDAARVPANAMSIVKAQCNVDMQSLRSQKQQFQQSRSLMMNNCTSSVTPSGQVFCTNNRFSAGQMNGRQCFQQARMCKRECMQFKNDCSLAAICHEKYEISPLHDQIHSVNLQLLQAKECMQSARNQGLLGRGRSGKQMNRMAFPETNRDLPGFEDVMEVD